MQALLDLFGMAVLLEGQRGDDKLGTAHWP